MIKVNLTFEDGRTFEYDLVAPIIIGRDQHCGLRINNWRVAREHGRIDLLGHVLQIEDFGSLGGTRVNHKRIAQYAPLLPEDIIQIGPCRMTVQCPSLHPDTPLVSTLSGTCASDSPTPTSTPTPTPTAIPTATPTPKLFLSTQSPRQLRTLDAQFEQTLQAHTEALNVNTLVTHELPSDPSNADRLIDCPQIDTLRRSLHADLIKELDVQKRDLSKLSDALLRDQCQVIVQQQLARNAHGLTPQQAIHLVQTVVHDAVGLGVLQVLLDDASVSEILVNRFDTIFVERHGQLERHPATFLNDQALRTVIDRIVVPIGRRIDDASPMVDARLTDGSRVNAVIAPVAIAGSCLTIRKFPLKKLTFDDLMAYHAIDAACAQFLTCCVQQKLSMLISGGTGSGKTTLLNILASLIPHSERIVTIEDAAELQIQHPHVVGLESRPGNTEGRGQVTIRHLVKNALRMRPDRIVVGECRGAESVDMLAAMNTGHTGSLTTLHANSCRDALSRLETMVLMAGMELPMAAIRDQIARAVQLLVQQTRLPNGRRVISAIEQVTGIESGQIQTQSIMRYQASRQVFEWSKLPPTFLSQWRQQGVVFKTVWCQEPTQTGVAWST